jgi:hypothetical protein
MFLRLPRRELRLQQVLEPVHQRAPPAAVDHAFDRVAVGDEQLQQRHQVGCGPVAVDVGLGEADVAAAQRRAAGVPVDQAQRGARLVVAAEVGLRAVGQLHVQAADTQARSNRNTARAAAGAAAGSAKESMVVLFIGWVRG